MMKYLVVGLGSMGKRRIRNLIALGENSHLAGFDPREDRKIQAEKYGIELFSDFDVALKTFKPDVFIISTPPAAHMHYAFYGLEHGISCFIEASVVDAEKIKELHQKASCLKILMAPSCTMRYYPAPLKIKELIKKGTIGKVLNINYMTGQYLPDWHPWEDIKDFYVSDPDTGGCREIVPFELTWLNDIFGNPKPLACIRRKLTDMPIVIDDIYHCLLEYPDCVLANITVEVISRPKATRDIRIIGSQGEITFSGDTNSIKFINTEMTDWEVVSFESGTVEKDYINPEEPYIEEMRAFVSAVKRVRAGEKSTYPNTLLDDYNVLQNLYELEHLAGVTNELSR